MDNEKGVPGRDPVLDALVEETVRTELELYKAFETWKASVKAAVVYAKLNETNPQVINSYGEILRGIDSMVTPKIKAHGVIGGTVGGSN